MHPDSLQDTMEVLRAARGLPRVEAPFCSNVASIAAIENGIYNKVYPDTYYRIIRFINVPGVKLGYQYSTFHILSLGMFTIIFTEK